MAQFLTDGDQTVVRICSELTLMAQVVEAQKKQIAELITEKRNLEKKLNGYEQGRPDAPEEQGRSESESLSGQRRNMDNRRRSHSNGGSAET